MKEVWGCNECKYELLASFRFCPYCGEYLDYFEFNEVEE